MCVLLSHLTDLILRTLKSPRASGTSGTTPTPATHAQPSPSLASAAPVQPSTQPVGSSQPLNGAGVRGADAGVSAASTQDPVLGSYRELIKQQDRQIEQLKRANEELTSQLKASAHTAGAATDANEVPRCASGSVRAPLHTRPRLTLCVYKCAR